MSAGDQGHRGRLPAARSAQLSSASPSAHAGLLAEGEGGATQLQPDPLRPQQEHPLAGRRGLLHAGSQVRSRDRRGAVRRVPACPLTKAVFPQDSGLLHHAGRAAPPHLPGLQLGGGVAGRRGHGPVQGQLHGGGVLLPGVCCSNDRAVSPHLSLCLPTMTRQNKILYFRIQTFIRFFLTSFL